MSFLLFIDESGQDRRDSPCEVLAGIAIEDRDLWNLITAIQQADLVCALEYRAKRDMGENKVRVVRSFKLIEDLRPREERFRQPEK